MRPSSRAASIPFADMAFVGGAVMLIALIGIATRPFETLASFWPANAALLGIFIRYPRLVRWPNIAAALLGFVAADVITGSSIGIAVQLSAANLTGVCLGAMVALRASESARTLRHHHSIATLLQISIIASLGAAAIGCLVAPETLGSSRLNGFGYWFGTEFANYMVVLPLFLLVPLPPSAWFPLPRRTQSLEQTLKSLVPIMGLIASLGVAALIGGSGAIAIPVPFLIWCSLVYTPCATAGLNFVVGLFFMFAGTYGWLDIQSTDNRAWEVISLRLGISLLTLGPLTLAIIDRNRNEALLKLRKQAEIDSLTKVFNRRIFEEQGERMVNATHWNRQHIAVIMLDIDHFKAVNDTHGHGAGDHILTSIASIMTEAMPPNTLIGRLGGEEFAAMLPDVDLAVATLLAEGVCQRIAESSYLTERYGELHVTVSIGVVFAMHGHTQSFDGLLHAADRALYQAKAQGRNRVSVTEEYPTARRRVTSDSLDKSLNAPTSAQTSP